MYPGWNSSNQNDSTTNNGNQPQQNQGQPPPPNLGSNNFGPPHQLTSTGGGFAFTSSTMPTYQWSNPTGNGSSYVGYSSGGGTNNPSTTSTSTSGSTSTSTSNAISPGAELKLKLVKCTTLPQSSTSTSTSWTTVPSTPTSPPGAIGGTGATSTSTSTSSWGWAWPQSLTMNTATNGTGGGAVFGTVTPSTAVFDLAEVDAAVAAAHQAAAVARQSAAAMVAAAVGGGSTSSSSSGDKYAHYTDSINRAVANNMIDPYGGYSTGISAAPPIPMTTASASAPWQQSVWSIVNSLAGFTPASSLPPTSTANATVTSNLFATGPNYPPQAAAPIPLPPPPPAPAAMTTPPKKGRGRPKRRDLSVDPDIKPPPKVKPPPKKAPPKVKPPPKIRPPPKIKNKMKLSVPAPSANIYNANYNTNSNTMLANTAYPPPPGGSTSAAANLATAIVRTMHNMLPGTSFQAQTQAVPTPPPPLLAFPPSAWLPMPPNWMDHQEDTISSLATFKTFPVDPTSAEYTTLQEFLSPVQVVDIQQIINPELWKRFVSTRKDMFRSKSDDTELLSKLGLDDKEILQSAHISFNWSKHNDVAAVPYSDNMALLFHCTRSKAGLDSILSQGLDERLSNTGGGLLGRGIYFADNPDKSIQYDGGTGIVLICAVLLGDCLSVDHLPNRNTFVREPEKTKDQKRNFNDHFFDSIVGRPGPNNEYVIYNRYQCCPMYQVQYSRTAARNQYGSIYTNPRQALPPISWIPQTQGAGAVVMPYYGGSTHGWCFNARTIYSQMGIAEPIDQEEEDRRQEEEDRKKAEAIALAEAEEEAEIIQKLDTLACFGFLDAEKNRQVLKKYNNDLDRSMNYLLDTEEVTIVVEPKPKNVPATSSTAATTSTAAAVKNLQPDLIDLSLEDDAHSSGSSTRSGNSTPQPLAPATKKPKLEELPVPPELSDWALDFLDYTRSRTPSPSLTSTSTSASAFQPTPEPEIEECPICSEEYPSVPSLNCWKSLSCSHKVCNACHKQIEKTRSTMSGSRHTSIKCPFCQGITGIEIGDCPNGVMNVTEVNTPCTGYEGYTSWTINYSVADPTYRVQRTAYIPNNDEGRKVLALLKIAWDRRLCFTIGTSNTTGAENVLVWNIHHKTALSGGVASYGYPDAQYLDRVRWELKTYGIE